MALTALAGCNSKPPKHDCSVEGHVFIRYTYNNDATCKSDGTESAVCEHCDEVKTNVKLGTKLNECVYVDGECKWCGSLEPQAHVCSFNMYSYNIIDSYEG